MAEAALDELVGGEQFAAKVLRDEEEADDRAADEIADDQLQEAEILVVGEAGDADDGESACLCRDDGERDGPPGDCVVREEVVFEGALLALKPEAEEGNADQIHGDYGEVEGV